MTLAAIIREEAMVRMRDGTRLATDIYLPPDWQPGVRLPVLLERTPYNKRGTNHGDRTALDPIPVSKPEIAEQFVEGGYAYVLQDCRGRFGSEGTFTKYLNEAEDGYDTMTWLTQQSWCDGRIGTLGLSYCAHVQAAMATLRPPGLCAMFLDCGGFSSAYHNGVRQGGAFELKQCTWVYNQAIESGHASGIDEQVVNEIRSQDIRAWLRVSPWKRGCSPVAAAPDYENYILEQWEHENFSPYWRQRGIYWRGFYEETADVPMTHLSGWYDPYSVTAIENFVELSRRKTSPMGLILGPWTHGQRSVTFAGDVDFGSNACLDGNLAENFVALRMRWFNRFVRGLDSPDPMDQPVRIFVMGGGSGRRNAEGRLDHGGKWRTESTWPPASAHAITKFLHVTGQISLEPPTHDSSMSYYSDPADPVPTIGGAVTSGAPVMAAGGYNQRETPDLYGARDGQMALADRADVIVFQTDPLEDDMEVTGQVLAELYVSSSAVDTDFVVKLLDVYPPNDDYPDGYALNLAHGIIRSRFRHSFENPEPLQLGKVERIEVELFPTSNIFCKGHRLRIDIASSNFPHFDVNPNTDWRVPDAKPQIAKNTLHFSRDHATRIVIPVIAS
jgi:uncharacterized protein